MSAIRRFVRFVAGAIRFGAPLFLLLCAVQAASTRSEGLLTGSGVVLPVRDQVGAGEIADVVEHAVADELRTVASLREDGGVRDALRALRIRDSANASPTELDLLARKLQVRWMLAPSLHESSEGPVPQITISARLYIAGEVELAWAGFESASGLDERRTLGRGVIERIEPLAETTARRLVRRLIAEDRGAATVRRRAASGLPRGFRVAHLSVEQIGCVAVVPFDAALDRRGIAIAAAVTELALAELHARGVCVLTPGLVEQVLRSRGRLWRGEVELPALTGLSAVAGVDHVLTGSIEVYETSGGIEPEPRVGYSARLLDARSGRVVWINGDERSGWEHGAPFRTGRLYDAGRLAENIMAALVSDFLIDPRSGRTAQ